MEQCGPIEYSPTCEAYVDPLAEENVGRTLKNALSSSTTSTVAGKVIQVFIFICKQGPSTLEKK